MCEELEAHEMQAALVPADQAVRAWVRARVRAPVRAKARVGGLGRGPGSRARVGVRTPVLKDNQDASRSKRQKVDIRWKRN